jgi:hypothetical protein
MTKRLMEPIMEGAVPDRDDVQAGRTDRARVTVDKIL